MIGSIVVPALTPLTTDGRLDHTTLTPYLKRAADTWVDAFLISGSTTRGDLLSVEQRTEVLDAWLQVVEASRLVACCWQRDDLIVSADRGVVPMWVMRDLPDATAALRLFASLPAGGYVYSHPMYSPTVLSAELAAAASAAGVLPAGGKIAKIDTEDVAGLRTATGAGFRLWDGSSRRIAASVAAGATGVIATPLSPLPTPFPAPDLPVLQPAINAVQAELDALPDRPHRTALLQQRSFGTTNA